ncbi:MAG: dihydrolipoamide acetyltransferase [Deltaproteobacteria bacterium]|nr:dihydrolipoamide acetyltransferase [Deltaproteobacteria bacterium]
MLEQLRTIGLSTGVLALLLVLPGLAHAQGDEGGDAAAEETAEPAEEGADEAPAAEDAAPEAEEAPAATASADADGDPEMSIFRELKTVEADVNELKEKVFRSKARLLLLEEKVIRGVVSGAKTVIRHVNNLGPAYALESVTYYFDGNPIYQATDASSAGELSKTKKAEIFEANIPPGNHTLSATGVIKGRGAGLFEYLSDYSFQFSASYSFVAPDGQTSRIDSVLFKKGGPMADYVEGPTVEFRVRPTKGAAKGGGESEVSEGGE